MELTNKQEEAIKCAVYKYTHREKYMVLAGPAGSGKSTSVKYIIEALSGHGVNPNKDVCFAAFTGKACKVLQTKGNQNVSTLHRLLFKFVPTPQGTYIRKIKSPEEIKYKVICVDECSMVSQEMVDILLKLNSFIIFCGDNHQLSPIDKEGANNLFEHIDVYLDEIMRQALDSGIIRLSMKINAGENFDNFTSDDVRIFQKSELTDGMLNWADQILCATNNTRKILNQKCRQLKGFTKSIEENEKLIVCRNYWEKMSIDGNYTPLINGTIGTLTDLKESYFLYPNWIKIPGNKVDYIRGNFVSDIDEDFGQIVCDKQNILTGNPSLSMKQKYQIGKNKMYLNKIPYELTYSYAITTWKAQGSEFNKVLGFEESFPFDREEHRRYLYTLVTRASDKLTLIRG